LELPRYEYDYTTTLNGTAVRLYAFDGGGEYPIHGAYYAGQSMWIPCSWTYGGKLRKDGSETQLDLTITFEPSEEDDPDVA